MTEFTNLTVNCLIDSDCPTENSVCSLLIGTCKCNSWYGWRGVNCQDLSPNTTFIIVILSFIIIMSIVGVILGFQDLLVARQKLRKSQVYPKRRINAAMATTLNAVIALILMIIWSSLSLASTVSLSLKNTSDPIVSVTMFGKFEESTAFIAPIVLITSSLSLMRTSLMWIEIAARSKSMRPVLGANFRRTNRVLVFYHVFLVLTIVSCWLIAFLWPRSDREMNLRLVMAIVSVPIFLIVLAFFRVGSTRLRSVLNEASAPAIHGNRSSVPHVVLRDSSKDSFKSTERNAILTNEVNAANANNNNNNNKRISSESANMAVPTAPTNIIRKESVDTRFQSRGASDFTAAGSGPGGGNAARIERWKRHSTIVHVSDLSITSTICTGLLAIIAFAVLEIVFGWRDPPPIFQSEVSIIVIFWMISIFLLALTQVLVILYVHEATTTKKKHGSSETTEGRQKRPTFTWFGGSSLTVRERNGSIVNQEVAAVANPGFMRNPGDFKIALSHIKEESTPAQSQAANQDSPPHASQFHRTDTGVKIEKILDQMTAISDDRSSLKEDRNSLVIKSDDRNSLDTRSSAKIEELNPPIEHSDIGFVAQSESTKPTENYSENIDI